MKMNYKEKYLAAYKEMEAAAVERLKQYGKTLDVIEVCKQKLMESRGYKSEDEMYEDELEEFIRENYYGCVFEDKHNFLHWCNIMKVRYSDEKEDVEVYLEEEEGGISEWFDVNCIGIDKDAVWITILDFIDGEEEKPKGDERLAIIDHDNHTLYVEDVTEEDLAKYNGEEEEYIKDNFDIENYSWDYIVDAYYYPDGYDKDPNEIEFKKD